jgi:hypothetical protein
MSVILIILLDVFVGFLVWFNYKASKTAPNRAEDSKEGEIAPKDLKRSDCTIDTKLKDGEGQSNAE